MFPIVRERFARRRNAWGWKRGRMVRAWLPRGASIGWLDGQNLYLEPSCSYEVAQQMAGNGRLAVSEQALRHRLRQARCTYW